MKASQARSTLEPRLSLVVKATQYLPPVLLCRRTLTGTRNSQPSHLLPNNTQDGCLGVPRGRKEEATASPMDKQISPAETPYSTKKRCLHSPSCYALCPCSLVIGTTEGRLEPAQVQSTRRKLRVDVPRLCPQLDSSCPRSDPIQAPSLCGSPEE